MTVTKLVMRAGLLVFTLMSAGIHADQTDERLDALFQTLKTSQDPSELETVERDIWEIWFDSGQQEVDELMEKAELAMQAGQLGIAEAIYSRVVEMAPGFSEGWNRRATVRYYREDYEGSFSDIERTLYLEPRHFGATWGLGMILEYWRDYGGAIAAFERLLEIKPNSDDIRRRIDELEREQAKSAV